MRATPRWPAEAWIPLLAGLYWLWSAPGHGFLGFVFSVVPGCLLLGSGLVMLLMPGDFRISQFAAIGGVLGVVLGLPALFVVGFGHGLLLIAGSAASFLVAGWHTVRLEPHPEEVPAPIESMALAGQVACDEAILSTMLLGVGRPQGDDFIRIAGEIDAAREQFASAGWLEKPAEYHTAPPDLVDPQLRSASLRGIAYEKLSFDSGYEPREGEPGRDRWLGYTRNRKAHAWVLRHAGGDRPWLVCIHGYQMGSPGIDIRAFRPDWIHEKLGINMIFPVLPLHGPRAKGRRSGDGFIAGEILDTVHAEAQAMWDIRRLLSWVRSQGEGPVGAYGLSLGGYNTALLASLDPDLACAIPGIPATDFTRLFYRHSPSLQVREGEFHGLVEEHMGEVLRVVSPLELEPLVPHDRRYIFAGVADRLVPADQVRDLWRHWDRPRIEWYQGAHVTFAAHPAVRGLIKEALRESGLAV
jgi:hypothetical protein